jgi:TorA maturation chaperone TorD
MHNDFDADFLAQTRGRMEAYSTFARLFRQEVSSELLQRLRVAREGSGDPEGGGIGQIMLDRYLSATDPLEDTQVIAELASDYANLFLNAGSLPAHPYESVYTSPDRLLMREEWDKVREMYAAAGLKRSPECREPEDHIALEMEFMRHLCFRTAAAIEEGRVEMVGAHLRSQREFLGNHLLRWAPRFCRDLVRNASTGFYRALGHLVSDFLELEADLIAGWSPD